VVVLGVLGFAATEFAGQVGQLGQAASHTALTTPDRVTRQGAASATPRATRAAQTTATAPAAPATPAATAPAPVPAPPVRTIVPVSAVAFGPDGVSDGDNPQNAARVLTDPAQGWQTDWYMTPDFGALRTGTGLLLDMGRAVTITTVGLTLGFPGADFQLRAGMAPDFGALPVVATATDAGDAVSLPLAAPVKARYVLLWFTKLPPDGVGTYQVFVHQVEVQGRALADELR
jgi:hypothetical protein